MLSNPVKTNASTLERAGYHAWFHHGNSDGWIAVCRKEREGFVQKHYKPEELAEHLSEWLGENIYFSQNTFFKPFRRIENIRQLRSLYVDIDCHKLNLKPELVIDQLKLEKFRTAVPEPNLIIYTGRGLALVWLIEPAPYKALPLWNAIQNFLHNQFLYVGSDPASLDASRILRIDGTLNSKNGAEVTVDYLSDYRYSLREIQTEFLPEIQPSSSPNRNTKGRKKKVHSLFNTYSLHHSRLLDLCRLVEMRNYEMLDMRETTCFLYRYWTCCFLSDPKEALRQTLEFNQQFRRPLSKSEVTTATRSAETAWEAKNNDEANRIAKSKGYPGAGYHLTNAKVIKWLKITEEEQKPLLTLIGKKEKQYRDTISTREKRGSVTREEYLQGQADKTDSRLDKLRELMKRYPNAKGNELAEMMGVTPARISQLMKQIYKN